jgi:hypothetical protein
VPEWLSWWQSAAVLVLYGSLVAYSIYEIRGDAPAPPWALGVPLVVGLGALAATRWAFTFGAARARHRDGTGGGVASCPAMEPTVCRMVHYVSYGTPPGPDGTQAYRSQCRAAVVTEVGQWVTVSVADDEPPDPGSGVRRRIVYQEYDPQAVALAVFSPTGQFYNGAGMVACRHDEDVRAGGTWHWPERTDASPAGA